MELTLPLVMRQITIAVLISIGIAVAYLAFALAVSAYLRKNR